MAKTMTRRARRVRYLRRRRTSILIFCALLLVAVGVYYLTQYREDKRYAEYPLRYEELILQYAGEYSLDPAHVAAVIRTESSFVPDALSPVGAIGLMQLMPDTGSWIAFRLDETYDDTMLLDPAFNIRYGCWYLMFLAKRYENDITCISAAYHAGSGVVDEWLQDPAYSVDGATLIDIPYPQTKRYVEKIQKTYEIYQELYPL